MERTGGRPIRALIYHRSEAEAYRRRLASIPGYAWLPWRDETDLAGAVAEAEVILALNLPEPLWPKARRVRWVQALAAGVDKILRASLPPDVRITRIEEGFGPWIAEYVFGHLLAVTQRVGHYAAMQRERRWAPVRPDRLHGRTIGIAGLGAIGRTIAARAAAFEMRVLGYSRSGRPVDGVEAVFTGDRLHDFLRPLDYLVLILPHTPATDRLIDARALAALPRGAWLVNVGRGRLVDERALIEALRAGHLGGAVLDVFADEPLPPESPLWSLPNVVVTPHVAGPTLLDDAIAFCAENLERYRDGRPLRGLVDRQAGY